LTKNNIICIIKEMKKGKQVFTPHPMSYRYGFNAKYV